MLELHDVRMRFGQKQVLKGIGLAMGEGVYGLLGPNGSGKTTPTRRGCVANTAKLH